MDILAQYQNIFIWIIGIFFALICAWFGTRFATKDEHKTLRSEFEKERQDNQKKFSEFEGHVKHLPTKEQFQKLEISMTRFEGKLELTASKFDSASEVVDRVQLQADRLEEYLLRGGK